VDAGGDSGKTCPFCAVNDTCCGGACVDEKNDPEHCGDCNTKCNVSKQACVDGKCVDPCAGGGVACSTMQLCCGVQCCDQGQICCSSGGAGGQLYCFTPTSTVISCPP
jgi:hypothetical protein